MTTPNAELLLRVEAERAVKALRYAAHPQPSPNADALAEAIAEYDRLCAAAGNDRAADSQPLLSFRPTIENDEDWLDRVAATIVQIAGLDKRVIDGNHIPAIDAADIEAAILSVNANSADTLSQSAFVRMDIQPLKTAEGDDPICSNHSCPENNLHNKSDCPTPASDAVAPVAFDWTARVQGIIKRIRAIEKESGADAYLFSNFAQDLEIVLMEAARASPSHAAVKPVVSNAIPACGFRCPHCGVDIPHIHSTEIVFQFRRKYADSIGLTWSEWQEIGPAQWENWDKSEPMTQFRVLHVVADPPRQSPEADAVVKTAYSQPPKSVEGAQGDILRLASQETYEGTEHWVIRFPSYYNRTKEESLAEFLNIAPPPSDAVAPVAYDVEFEDGHRDLYYPEELDEVAEEEAHGPTGNKDALYASPSHAGVKAVVSEAMVTVPREPTAPMIQAAIDTFGMQPSFAAMRRALRAALSAPRSPVKAGDVEETK